MNNSTHIDNIFDNLLSLKIKKRSERIILAMAIISYAIHLVLILMVKQGFINIESKFFKNPIAAIYTPFSFILVYEVYLLIYFLPKSISTYIGKQYEIITLIVIRRIFKDIGNLELQSNWFENSNDLQFTYDTITSLLLFFLIYLFYKKNANRNPAPANLLDEGGLGISRFIQLKKVIAIILVPILIILASFTFYSWTMDTVHSYQNGLLFFADVNRIFFEDFFTILIMMDVLLLLSSFFYSDDFSTIMRNSGFIISTILIKISFSVEGIISNALILGAVLFGYLILTIHGLYTTQHSAKY
jgi:hypothetical protein